MLQVRPWLPAGPRTVNRLIPTQTHQRGHTQDQLDRAVDRLQQLGRPAALTEYLSLLKACNKTKSLSQAKRIHAHLAHHGLDLTGFLGENLLVTLARCGAFVDALHFFHSLPCRTVFAWTALISGFTDCGRAPEALMMYQCMLEDGVEPDTYTFVSLFKACGNIPDLEQGKKLHADARGKGFTSDVFVGNTLVSMYGKCGDIVEAENVFAELSRRDIVSCNAMISVYVEQGQVEKALLLYRQMHEEALNPPDDHTVMFALQAIRVFAEKEEAYFVNGPSPKVMSFEIGQTLHAYARRKGFTSNTFVGNTLVSMYGNCGTIAHALNVFYGLSQPDIVSWTAMLSAFVEQGQAEKALQLYRELPQEDMNSNHQTFLVALQACSHLAEKEEDIMLEGQLSKPKSLEIGRAVHADARAKGLDTSLFVGNTLVSMYGKCGAILEAENVFAGLLHLDIVSWNAMLSAYVEQGQAEKALQVYRQMREENMSPNRQTFMTVLQACDDMAETEEAYAGEGHSTKVVSFEIGQALHADAWRRGLASDVFVGTTLVRMYGKCGTILEAENAFGGLSQNDIVSCTAMLSAYVEQGEEEKALLLYRWMQKEGVTLDDVTLVCILQACRKTGRVEMGRQLHFFIISGGLDLNSFVGSSLIHVYGSFANMGDARAVFDGLPLPDVAAWNACIAGSAGAGNTSLQMFEEMQVESFRPDGLTFASVLSACSHAGLVDKGVGYFESMSRDHCLIKDVNHFVLMVDLLGRAGDFVRVQKVMDRVPKQADLATWLCLLGACRTHGNVELAKFAFDHVVNMQTKDAAAYVLMSNICVDAGLYEREEELGDIGSWGCCTCLDAKTSLPPTSLL